MNKTLSVLTIILGIVACNSNKTMKNNEPTAFDTAFIDSAINPCDNFYKFAVGNWMKNNPVPETESRWMAFNILAEENKQKLAGILEEVAKNKSAKNGSEEQLIRDLYISAMDTANNEAHSMEEVSPLIAQIDAIKNIQDLNRTFALFASIGIGTPVGFYVGVDDKNSKRYIVNASQTGISLPDRDYYFKTDEKSVATRNAFMAHINKMFALAKVENQAAGKAVLALETELAKIHLPRELLRDPDANYNMKDKKAWAAGLKNLDVTGIVAGIGLSKADTINVGQPVFYEKLDGLLKSIPLEDWKIFLKWKTVSTFAPFLGDEFEKEDFSFFSTELRGTAKMKTRKERVLTVIDGALGEPLGKLFVKQYFPEESKTYMSKMIENLRDAYKERIQNLTWMSAETKVKALKKLASFTYKIGYPNKWQDYSKLEITPTNYIKNIIQANQFAHQTMIDKFGKPVDKDEWFMTPQTVNAYYSQSGNEIVFPAGILQPPFFHPSFDAAINYGGIGAVIGHEFSHGFDDQGSKYDWDGNLSNWWTEDDRTAFDKLAAKLASQFDEYNPIEGLHVNGKLTLGENIADLGGITLSFAALQKELNGKEPQPIDGYTWQQRFFLGWANVWKGNINQEELKSRLLTDYHSPGEYRVLGPLSNFQPFYDAFENCTNGKMYRPDTARVYIW